MRKKSRITPHASRFIHQLAEMKTNAIISGNRNPGCDFCIKVAQALGEAPEKVLRLAEILPSSTSDDPTLAELHDLAENLPPNRREEALRYLRYLLK